jgi:hypothetical protein
MPAIRLRVVCGLLETMAIFSPKIALSKVDFPTLGRPTIDINPVLFIKIKNPFVG